MNSIRKHRIKKTTRDAILKHQRHSTDVGSTQVQIGVLSSKVERAQKHLRSHKKDNHNIRQIVQLVKKIKKLQNYQKRQSLRTSQSA